MNRINARVTAIECVDNLTVVSFDAQGTSMRMMALGLNLRIEAGSKVVLGVKASNISLAKALGGELSISNRLACTIVSVKNGELLSSVKLRIGESVLESIITRASSQRMNLEAQQEVTALIKASELSVVEVCDD